MTWQNELKHNITTVDQLQEYVNITPKEKMQLKKIIERHPMRITRYYMSLIDWDDPNDPIKKIAVPSIEELNLSGSYDTSGEKESTKLPGLQHKYQQTALILSTSRCAMYCRYCFRKRLVGLQTHEILKRFNEAVEYIKKHPEINNVLISGGDPFILPTNIIKRFLHTLSDISHLDFIRFGTRVPVTFPQRIYDDPEFLDLLNKYSTSDRRIYVVTQFNNPKEITPESKTAVDEILKTGVILNNQAVLLKGINDNPEILVTLQNKLVSIGINPYYLFQCRPVRRVKRYFSVPLYRGYQIVEESKKRLCGLGKRFKYIMSHRTGKIEIVGIMGNEIYFKQHQARNPMNIGKFFKRELNHTAVWLDELDTVNEYGYDIVKADYESTNKLQEPDLAD
ncbi:KamA family radical SAM protein [[Eubacterium] cellulosolvens]